MAHFTPLALLWGGKCHTLTCLSHRSLNLLPGATVKHQGKASSIHSAQTGIISSGVRAGKMTFGPQSPKYTGSTKARRLHHIPSSSVAALHRALSPGCISPVERLP